MIEAGLIATLLAEPTISALVTDRITPVVLPVGQAMPALTFQVMVGTSMLTLDTTGTQKWRLQFDGWGDTYLDASGVRDAVIRFLSSRQFTLNGTQVTFILIGPNGIPYSGGDELFRASFDMYAIFTLPSA